MYTKRDKFVMSHTRTRYIRGFTVIELSLAAVIGLIVLIMLFSASFTLQHTMAGTASLMSLAEKGRVASSRMTRDIREAKTILNNYGTYGTDSTTLILEVPSIGSSGTFVDPDTYTDIIIYRQSGTEPRTLVRIVDANDAVSTRNDSQEIVTDILSSLEFSAYGNPLSSFVDTQGIRTVTGTLTTEIQTMGITRSHTASFATSLRNKRAGF